MEEQNILVLRPSRAKWLLLSGICGFFALVALLGLLGTFGSTSGYEASLWGGLALFGGLSIVSALNLLPHRAYLRLDQDGFTARAFTHQMSYKWSDIEAFGLTRRRGGLTAVVFRFSPPDPSGSLLRKVDRALLGYDGALPDTYGLTADKLAQLMTEWKDRYRRTDDVGPPSGAAARPSS